MSRSAPPKAPTLNRSPVPPRVTKASTSGEVCPEVAAVAAELGITRPSKIRWLQGVFNRAMANAGADFAEVVTVLRRDREGIRRSVPVDLVGDRVARALDGGRP